MPTSSSTTTRTRSRNRESNRKSLRNKTEYTRWQSHLFNTVDTVLPTDGHPTVAYRRKVVLMIDFDVPQSSVSTSESSRILHTSSKHSTLSLPTKHKLQLYHFGERAKSTVSVGYDTNRKCFKHPATDFGGLTNVNQQPGETVSFVGTSTRITAKTLSARIAPLSRTLLTQWHKHSQRSSSNNASTLVKNLQSFLRSVITVLKDDTTPYTRAHLRFHVLTPELRMLYTMNDIRKLTGTYMVRDFNGDEQHFARTVSTKVTPALYLSVSRNPHTGERFITPNLNRQTIWNEYVGAI